MSDADEHVTTDAPPQPPAEGEVPEIDPGDESQLSDLDDEIFADYNEALIGNKGAEEQEQVPIDEDTVTTLGKYKKKGGAKASSEGATPAKGGKRRRRDKSARQEEDEEEQPVNEKPLTEEESKLPSSPTAANRGC
jgi:hypothetical protein